MPDTDQIWLRDRLFQVRNAWGTRHADTWQVEIDTHAEEHEGKSWEPALYHQGLWLAAQTVAELPGSVTSWRSQDDPGYPHPERGSLYVFGHHDVRGCTLSFGASEHGRILLNWESLRDVFWDKDYSENVPFRCHCTAVTGGA